METNIQSTNQSTQTSTQWTNIQSTNQPTNRPTNQPTNQSTNQSIKQPNNHPINQPINQPTYQPTNKSINQSVNQPINQAINQPINQTINQSTNQIAKISTHKYIHVVPTSQISNAWMHANRTCRKKTYQKTDTHPFLFLSLYVPFNTPNIQPLLSPRQRTADSRHTCHITTPSLLKARL